MVERQDPDNFPCFHPDIIVSSFIESSIGLPRVNMSMMTDKQETKFNEPWHMISNNVAFWHT